MSTNQYLPLLWHTGKNANKRIWLRNEYRRKEIVRLCGYPYSTGAIVNSPIMGMAGTSYTYQWYISGIPIHNVDLNVACVSASEVWDTIERVFERDYVEDLKRIRLHRSEMNRLFEVFSELKESNA